MRFCGHAKHGLLGLIRIVDRMAMTDIGSLERGKGPLANEAARAAPF